MTIFEKKKLERDMFRKIRDRSSLNEMKNVAPNMKTVPVITLNGLLVGGFYELKEKVDA